MLTASSGDDPATKAPSCSHSAVSQEQLILLQKHQFPRRRQQWLAYSYNAIAKKTEAKGCQV